MSLRPAEPGGRVGGALCPQATPRDRFYRFLARLKNPPPAPVLQLPTKASVRATYRASAAQQRSRGRQTRTLAGDLEKERRQHTHVVKAYSYITGFCQNARARQADSKK